MKQKELIVSRPEISRRVKELAGDIARDYAGGSLVTIGVLKGAFVFLADLIRELDLPVEVDFVRAASYGRGTVSSNDLRLIMDIELDIIGRDILIVEDIVDTGLTVSYLKELFKGRRARSVRICALIDKKERRQIKIELDYVGFEVGQGFLIGYGLDCAEQHRHYPEVYCLKD